MGATVGIMSTARLKRKALQVQELKELTDCVQSSFKFMAIINVNINWKRVLSHIAHVIQLAAYDMQGWAAELTASQASDDNAQVYAAIAHARTLTILQPLNLIACAASEQVLQVHDEKGQLQLSDLPKDIRCGHALTAADLSALGATVPYAARSGRVFGCGKTIIGVGSIVTLTSICQANDAFALHNNDDSPIGELRAFLGHAYEACGSIVCKATCRGVLTSAHKAMAHIEAKGLIAVTALPYYTHSDYMRLLCYITARQAAFRRMKDSLQSQYPDLSTAGKNRGLAHMLFVNSVQALGLAQQQNLQAWGTGATPTILAIDAGDAADVGKNLPTAPPPTNNLASKMEELRQLEDCLKEQEFKMQIQAARRRLAALELATFIDSKGREWPDAREMRNITALQLPELMCERVSEVRSWINQADDRLSLWKILNKHPNHRKSQSARDFFAYMEELTEGLRVEVPEELEIDFLVGRMLPYIQQG
ncbi:hypothetical protein KEM52_000325, partial [Ascosphaera acerosa]